MKTRQSLKHKLLVMLFCATAIPVFVVGIVIYNIVWDRLLSTSISSTQQMNNHKAEMFDLFANELETSLKDMTDSETTKAYLQLRDEPESESYYLNLTRLGEKLDSIIVQHCEKIDAVVFLWSDGSLPIVRTNGSAFPLLGDYLEKSPYKDMLKDDAAVHWARIGKESNERLFIYKVIYDVLTDKNLGIALLRVNDQYVDTLLSTSSRSQDCTLLLDTTGNTIRQVGSFSMPETDDIKDILTKSVRESYSQTLDNTLICVSESMNTNFQLVNIVSLKSITDSLQNIVASMIIAMVVAGVLGVIFALSLFSYLKKPILELHAAMTAFQEGDMDAAVHISRNDELGRLGDGFNEMVFQINKLIDDIEIEQRKKQEISMRFLQAQISPHFMYNTLNSIKALTRLNRNEEACEMITSLISLLYLASGDKEEITLQQEMSYVESYILLMSKRKDLDISLSLCIPHDLMACKVLKFTLQPFVENSIIHGGEIGSVAIEISAERDEDTLRIKITDDGCGFDVSSIQKKFTGNHHFNSIGIVNVQERLNLYYGDKYGVSISSEPKCGTTVRINQPFLIDK